MNLKSKFHLGTNQKIIYNFASAMKKEEKERKMIEHEKLMKQYLERVNEAGTEMNKVISHEIMEGERLPGNEKNDLVYENRIERESKAASLKKKGDLEMKRISKALEEGKFLSIEKDLQHKGMEIETINKVVQETIEETEILSKETEFDGSEVKEELISEEIIKIEPEEEEVLNEHSYAFTTPYDIEEEQSNDMKKEELISVKETSASPIIDVVDIDDDKNIILKKIEPKPVFPMRSIESEDLIVWNVLREGIDNEDLKYLQSAFESLHVFGSDVVKDHHWSNHPGILFKIYYKWWLYYLWYYFIPAFCSRVRNIENLTCEIIPFQN